MIQICAVLSAIHHIGSALRIPQTQNYVLTNSVHNTMLIPGPVLYHNDGDTVLYLLVLSFLLFVFTV